MTFDNRTDRRLILIRHACDLLRREGHEAISVRRVAKLAEMSAGAPYYYFPERRDLLLALAELGFGKLHSSAAGLAQDESDPRKRLENLVQAFLDFTSEEPEFADLMYESQIARPMDDCLKGHYHAGYDLLVEAVANLIPSAPRTEASLRALTMWTTIYGLSRLLRHGSLEPFESMVSGELRQRIISQAIDDAGGPFGKDEHGTVLLAESASVSANN